MTLYGLIMAGGTGSRLWPRSRRRHPKQFLPLLSNRTMVQETIDRIASIIDASSTMIVTGHEYIEHVVSQMEQIPLNNIIAEPSGKGTAPAIGLGAIEIARRDPMATMAVLSADHMIRKAHAFRQALKAAEEVAQQGFLVTLGIRPSEPHTGYGYIQRGASMGQFQGFEAFEVAGFVEKPDRATAEGYLATGNYSWNAGIFIWRVDVILAALQTHLPDLYHQLRVIEAAGGPSLPQAFDDVWGDVANVTIDYGIMERASKVAIIPVDIGWSDVGDWDTLTGLALEANEPEQPNVVYGQHVGIDTHRTLVYSDQDRLIATIGLDDFVVVDTGDALMIAPRGRAQDVKKIVDELRARERGDLL